MTDQNDSSMAEEYQDKLSVAAIVVSLVIFERYWVELA
jgi:hypothetical protein